jgi:hypothetical protein
VKDILHNSDSLSGGIRITEDIEADLVFTTDEPIKAAKVQRRLDEIRKQVKALLSLLGGNKKDAAIMVKVLESGKVFTNGLTVHFQSRMTAADLERASKK